MISRTRRFTVAWTARLKDEYAGDKSTGKKIPRIFQDLPYRADLAVQIDEKTGEIYTIKNGFTDKKDLRFPHGITLPEIIKQLSIPPVPVTSAPAQ